MCAKNSGILPETSVFGQTETALGQDTVIPRV